jgi:hypothetical protein
MRGICAAQSVYGKKRKISYNGKNVVFRQITGTQKQVTNLACHRSLMFLLACILDWNVSLSFNVLAYTSR